MNYKTKAWSCQFCTFINTSSYYKCEICEKEDGKFHLDIPYSIENDVEQRKRIVSDNYKKVFGDKKILLPVIHVTDYDQTAKNTKVCFDNGADGVWYINHNIDSLTMIEIIREIRKSFQKEWIGLNILDMNAPSVFNLVTKLDFRVDGVWCDNSYITESENNCVADLVLTNMLDGKYSGLYFGSIAFKGQYKPNDLAKNVKMALKYVDVIVTSGEQTGIAPLIDKVENIHSNCENVPIAIASGININNVAFYKKYVTCFMVWTGITDSEGNHVPELVRDLVNFIKL